MSSIEAITQQLKDEFETTVSTLTSEAQAIEETRLEMIQRHSEERGALAEKQQEELATIKTSDDFDSLKGIYETAKNLAEMLDVSGVKVIIPQISILGTRKPQNRSADSRKYGIGNVVSVLEADAEGGGTGMTVGEIAQQMVSDDANDSDLRSARAKIGNALNYGLKKGSVEVVKMDDGYHNKWKITTPVVDSESELIEESATS